MAALLVAVAILMVMMMVALPTWSHQARREKEIELVFRGEQYARAISLYRAKMAGAFPPSLDVLVEQKFLRRKYKDPITGEDFVPVFANSPLAAGLQQQGAETGPPAVMTQSGLPSAPQRGGSVRIQAQQQPGRVGGSPATSVGQGMPGPGAPSGIVGVVSKSKDKSIRLYNGRDQYDQWVFVYTLANRQPQPAGPQAPPPGARQGGPLQGPSGGRGRGQ